MNITDGARDFLKNMLEEKNMYALCLYLDPTGNLSLALVEENEIEDAVVEEVNGVNTVYYGMTDLLKDNLTLDFRENGLTVEIPPSLLEGMEGGCGGSCGSCGGGCGGCGGSCGGEEGCGSCGGCGQ